MAKIEVLWMILEMAHHNAIIIQLVFWDCMIRVGKIQVAGEGSELWALQVDGYVHRSDLGVYNSDPLQATSILPTLINPGKQTVFMKFFWAISKIIHKIQICAMKTFPLRKT